VYYNTSPLPTRGCRSRDRMVVGFITTYAISVYHHRWLCLLDTMYKTSKLFLSC